MKKAINRFMVLTKRILCSRLYIFMLILLVSLTAVYRLLPEKEQNSDINVLLCFEEESDNNIKLLQVLQENSTIYRYEQAASLEDLRRMVEAKKAECGIYIPGDFYECYVNGEIDKAPIDIYITPSSTLYKMVFEEVFSQIFKICSLDILYFATDTPFYEDKQDELKEWINYYLSSKDTFRIESLADNNFITNTTSRAIKLPVKEISLLLILLCSLLCILLYTRDSEKNMFITLSTGEKLSIRIINSLAGIAPIVLLSIVCCLITYNKTNVIFDIASAAIAGLLINVFPGCLIKKSSTLEKLLPCIMLILTVIIFVTNLL